MFGIRHAVSSLFGSFSFNLDRFGWPGTRRKSNGDICNFWTVKPHKDNSWLANKLIKMREDVYLWIKLRIGNGVHCRFWSDNWSPFGKLQNFLNASATSRLGIPARATVVSLFRRNRWCLPSAR
ncbi:unnamed protein product [Microthlaspi erraticum]|uniref:Reverse transcriptase zinc-binding domain-containing protein n=1 Tax=Microthlaspi erraticum TaxID=1685480 RepID=A0A6D2HI18_9BRAS|nr:unnamed protein product [Microthlaspi erraticum]